MNDHAKNKALGIPPRWLKCPRKGLLIAEKFLPFKTPLSEIYNSQVPDECKFTPDMLIGSLRSYKIKMGLWIDLTNTDRFYDKSTVEKAGIKYLKLQCRGHGECPSRDQTSTFISICQTFVQNNPLDVIGIHCTHGFNRTGFLIISYLVEVLNWSFDAAMDMFAKARPPGIYKADYLSELFKLYADFSDPTDQPVEPSPPLLPDWCIESDDNIDDDGNVINGESSEVHQKRRKEFRKRNPTFMEGVRGVTPIGQPTLLQIQRKCQNMCEWQDSGFPGCQPVSMDIENIKLLETRPYKVSWKADGNRYMMLIDGKNEVYFIDRDNAVFQVKDLRFPRRKNYTEHICDTLLDGEMVIDKVNNESHPRYLVYDIVRFESNDMKKRRFDERLLYIEHEIIKPRNEALRKGILNRMSQPFGVRAKAFLEITEAKKYLDPKFTKELPHEVDGLIFQPVNVAYTCGTCPQVLKWKPPSLNSVDFKLKLQQIGGEGMLRETKCFLYVGGCDQPFGELKYSKSLKAFDKKIVECKFENNQWQLLRERTDKSFPNGFNTAVAICKSITNPVTKDKLLEFIEHHRWMPDPTMVKAHQNSQFRIPQAPSSQGGKMPSSSRDLQNPNLPPTKMLKS